MFGSVEWVVLMGLSGIATLASLSAWRERTTYGLFRFIAFEVLAVLVAVNASRWFQEPVSARQLASWTLLGFATALAAHGVWLLRIVGKARQRVMEDTRVVVDVGAYRYIRHPLYAALILFTWGVFLKGSGIATGALATAATAFLIATARSEERFNARRLGRPYTEYMNRTKMFVPFLV